MTEWTGWMTTSKSCKNKESVSDTQAAWIGTELAGVRWPGERRSGVAVELGEPHGGGCAHGRFRNLT
jgi:hypothetical protein